MFLGEKHINRVLSRLSFPALRQGSIYGVTLLQS